MIWRSGLDARCDYFNSTWLEFTGRSLDQELGDGWAEGVHPDDLERCIEIYRSHFARREPFEMEYRLRRHDGVYRYIFDRGSPYADGSGAFAGFIGSCHDVHDRVCTEQAHSRFLSMVTHEFRTPLQLLTGHLEILKRNARGETPPNPAALDKLGTQIRQIAQLVTDLAEAAQLPGGARLQMALVSEDLCRIVREVVSERSEMPRGGSKHVLVFSTELDAAPVACDPGRIAQLLQNLLDNAIKYTPSGAPIQIDVTSAGDVYRVSVSDRGIGIPQAELQQLGRPYFRASNARSDRFAGIGLGLTVARDIAEQHGGKLWLEGNAQGGTVANFSIPQGFR